jgi:hypothetical protein
LGEAQTLQLILETNDDAVNTGAIQIRSSSGLRIHDHKEGVMTVLSDGAFNNQALGFSLIGGKIQQLPPLPMRSRITFMIPVFAAPDRGLTHEVC